MPTSSQPRTGSCRSPGQDSPSLQCRHPPAEPRWKTHFRKCQQKVSTLIILRYNNLWTFFHFVKTLFIGILSPKKNAYQRSVNAYYKHIERINLERTQSLSSIVKPPKSGKPSILKPLKLWKPTQGKEKMVWVYGNPWSENDPRYLRTGSGQMTKLEERLLKDSGELNIGNSKNSYKI